MFKKLSGLGLTVGMALLIGCQPIRPAEAPALVPAPSPQITQEETMTLEGLSSNPVTVEAAKNLASRLGVAIDQITLVSEEIVVWPDGALGCPQPGMMYAQVLQDGMRIILSANGTEYHYHSGDGRPPFLCENPPEAG